MQPPLVDIPLGSLDRLPSVKLPVQRHRTWLELNAREQEARLAEMARRLRDTQRLERARLRWALEKLRDERQGESEAAGENPGLLCSWMDGHFRRRS